MVYFLNAPSWNAYENLARDEFILNELAPGNIVLYLYVNENAVVIGRNQNPCVECNLNRMAAEGVQLVRRISGGGAVYHDRGNLNFSFIASNDLYDVQRQTKVVLSALEEAHVSASVSERGDLTAGNRKFSGNAFCSRKSVSQRHGTLLIDSDLKKLSDYLAPSGVLPQSRGIKSVRSHVCNLKELSPDLSVDKMTALLKQSFETEYGKSVPYPMDASSEQKIRNLTQKNASWAWKMGQTPSFSVRFEVPLSVGSAELYFEVSDGIIKRCNVCADDLNTVLLDDLPSVLTGIVFEKRQILEKLSSSDENIRRIRAFLSENLSL